MTPLPRRPVPAGARPSPGRCPPGLTALPGLHLDSARAPAITWQLTGSGTGKISPTKCPHFQGNPTLGSAVPGARRGRGPLLLRGRTV